MWTQLLAWLRNPPVEESIPEHVARLISGLRDPDPATRRRTDGIVARILADDAGYGADFRLELLQALAEQVDAQGLEFVPRYVRLLANLGFSFGRPSPLQLAAQACLSRWQARENEQEQADTLLRAANAPVNSDTLLRPASGIVSTEPDQLLRESRLDEQKYDEDRGHEKIAQTRRAGILEVRVRPCEGIVCLPCLPFREHLQDRENLFGYAA